MFKFIHTADLHIDSPLKTLALRDEDIARRVGVATREALRRIVDACIEHEVHALLIAGDLFDGNVPSMHAVAFVTVQFERLNKEGIKVFVVFGNHDAESRLTRESNFPCNVKTFTGHGGCVELPEFNVAVHGISFSERSAPESLLPKLRGPVPNRYNIGILHTSLTGDSKHDTYAPCSVQNLIDHGFDYWALGHIHKREVHHKEPYVVMPGMPQGRDIGESGSKSATLVVVEDDNVVIEEIPTSKAIFERISYDIENLDEWRDVQQKILEQIKEKSSQSDAFLIARIELSGSTDLAWRIRRDKDQFREELSEFAREFDWAAIEKLNVSSPPRPPDPERTVKDGFSEFVTLIQKISTELSFTESANKDVVQVISKLPPEIRDDFGKTEDELVSITKKIIEDGVEDVIAHLAGAQDRRAS